MRTAQVERSSLVMGASRSGAGVSAGVLSFDFPILITRG